MLQDEEVTQKEISSYTEKVIARMHESGIDDTTFIYDLLDTYLQSTPGLFDDIRAYPSSTLLCIERAAHSMKSSCRLVAADECANICETIEMNARSGDVEQLDSVLATLEETYRHTEILITGALSRLRDHT